MQGEGCFIKQTQNEQIARRGNTMFPAAARMGDLSRLIKPPRAEAAMYMKQQYHEASNKPFCTFTLLYFCRDARRSMFHQEA